MVEGNFPPYLNQVEIPQEDDNKRTLLTQFDKRLVFLKDTHLACPDRQYVPGVIRIDKTDQEGYTFERLNTPSIKERLHFHDLEGLIIFYKPNFKIHSKNTQKPVLTGGKTNF